MMYSLVDGEKVEATPGIRGTCVCCGSETIAKCGTVMVHHWAHKSLIECDQWWESEGEWHRTWKRAVGAEDPARIEVTIRDTFSGKWHRADALSIDGWVIELQHSPLSPAKIQEREEFYGVHSKGMVWIFDHSEEKRMLSKDSRIQSAKAIVFVHQKDGQVALLRQDKTVLHTFPVEGVVKILSTKGVDKLVEVIAIDAAQRIEQFRRAEEERVRKEEARLRKLEADRIALEEYKARKAAEEASQRVAYELEEIRKLEARLNAGVEGYEYYIPPPPRFVEPKKPAKPKPKPVYFTGYEKGKKTQFAYDEDSIFSVLQPEHGDLENEDDIIWGCSK